MKILVIIVTFFSGFAAFFISYLSQYSLYKIFNTTDVKYLFPFIEEFLKPLGVWIILIFFKHHKLKVAEIIFISLIGAIIFLSLENFLYIFRYSFVDPIFISEKRLIFTTPLHIILTFLLSIGVIFWKKNRSLAIFIIMLSPILHLLFNIVVHLNS